MSGCNFQEKRFSVALSTGCKSIGYCTKCGSETDMSYKFNHELLCRTCWNKIPSLSSLDSGNFNTPKDKLYEFHSSALDMDITSKTQWKRELKKRGLTDNFEQGWSGRKRDIEQSLSSQHTHRKHNHEEVKNGVREALKSMNMYSREKLFIPKDKAPKGMIYK